MNYSIVVNQQEILVASYNKGIYTLVNPLLLVTGSNVPVITDDPLVDIVKDLQYLFSQQTLKSTNNICPSCVREDILTNEME